MRTSLLLASIPVTMACGSGEPAGTTRALLDTTTTGTIVVDNTPLMDRMAQAPWTLTEELRIGEVDGAGPTVFGEIYYFALDDDGSIFVLDGQAQELRHFAASGAYIQTIASKGAGPGELEGGYGVIWEPGGNLITTDIANRRYTIMSRTGDVIGTYMRTINGVIYPWLARFVDGRLLDIGLVRPGSGPGVLGTHNRFQFLHWTADYSRQDTLGFLDFPIVQITDRRISQPFAPRASINLTDSGTVWFTNNHEYRFVERTVSGDTLRIVTLPVEPVQVTMAERDSVVDQYAQYQVTMDRSEVYGTKPLVRRIVPRSDGGLLILPFVYPGGDGAAIDVFDPQGEFEGRVTSPVMLDHMPPPQVHGDYLYAVTLDELDVEYLVRLRITRRP